MNKFRLEDVKLSKKTDAQIKRQLYIMMLQKKLGKIGKSFINVSGLVKILAPVCVFAFAIIGFNSLTGISNPGLPGKGNIAEVKVESISKEHSIIRLIVASNITKKYTRRSMERIKKLRYQKYRQLSQVRTLTARAYKRG